MTEEEKNLRDHLARRYYKDAAIERVVTDAGMEIWKIVLDGSALDQWNSIVVYASFQQKVGALVNVARKDFPEDPVFKAAAEGGIKEIRGPEFTAPPVAKESLEALTQGASTLLPVHFLRQGAEAARSVALVRRADGGKGTGFLLPGNWFLTNHHVIWDAATAAQEGTEAFFNYDYEAIDAPPDSKHKPFKFDPANGFHTSPVKGGDDWTAVRIAGDAVSLFGHLTLCRAGAQVRDFVNIIQHAGGLAKRIALYHNTVVAVGDRRVRYLTDTLPGSSGSPVFNSQWGVVALHHSHANATDPDTGRPLACNEGIPASVLIEALERVGVM